VSNPNVEKLQVVADGLRDLNLQIAFVGGATTGLYITNPGAPEARPTMDVDCVAEIASYPSQMELESGLRKAGFKNDQSPGAPICRWLFRGIKVDIMPSDSSALGFSNSWYKDGVRTAVEAPLPDKKKIRIFTAPYFIASKIEAYKSRGNNDMRTSPDFEDLIYVMDNRNEIADELRHAEDKLKNYVKNYFQELLNNSDFEEGIAAALPYGTGRAGIERIKRIMNEIIADVS